MWLVCWPTLIVHRFIFLLFKIQRTGELIFGYILFANSKHVFHVHQHSFLISSAFFTIFDGRARWLFFFSFSFWLLLLSSQNHCRLTCLTFYLGFFWCSVLKPKFLLSGPVIRRCFGCVLDHFVNQAMHLKARIAYIEMPMA